MSARSVVVAGIFALLNFDKILTRADVSSLEKWIGTPAVKLLKILDPELVRSGALRKILATMKTPAELLFDPDARSDLIDLLSNGEAVEFANFCGLNGQENPWTALRTMRLRRNSKQHGDICTYFGLPIPEQPSVKSAPSIAEIKPTYSLFQHQRVVCRGAISKLSTAGRRVVLHMPTGAGKTRTAMHIIAQHLIANEPTTIIWLAYSEELCEQAASEFEAAWQSLGNRKTSVVRFWGKHEQDLRSCKDGLIVAGLGKIYSRAIADIQFIAALADSVSLIVIDEAHQAVAKSYSLILNTLQSKRSDAALLGLTATPGRSWDDLDEDRKLADFFHNQKVSLSVEGYSSPIDYLVDRKYLAKAEFRSLFYESGVELAEADLRSIERDLDVSVKVLKRLGEDEQRNLRILVEVEKLADTHSRILVFGASVENAELLSTALQAHGRVDARVVTGETPLSERQRVIKWYKAPESSPRVLCNYGVLTAGFDAPKTSAAVIGRPTKSLVLYSQMVGRALRGVRAGGNKTAEIVTVVDTNLPGFRDLAESFVNWEDAGWAHPTI